MTAHASTWEASGLEVLDNIELSAFPPRSDRARAVEAQLAGVQRIARTFVTDPENVLQQLVEAAVDLCGADSAGISIAREDRTDERFYHWVATAGEYSDFMNAVLPRYPSACGVCLERGRPQRFRVGQKFFDLMGIEAPLVTDGILLPWEADGTRGTIFVMAHGRTDAFDQEDCRLMITLADFAAMGVRQQRQQKQLIEQAGATAAAAMANRLAHRINNPLQSLTNILYLASEGLIGTDARTVGQQAAGDLERLSVTVKKLLALPYSSKEDARSG